MSDEEIPADEADSERGEGEDTLPSKADIKLWRRALRENWPISAEDRNQIIRDMMEAFILSESHRDKINAAKVIMLGDSLNVKRASMIGAAYKAGAQSTQVNVNVGVQVIGDPALQQKAEQYGLTQSRLAGMISTNGHQNGHTNGNGHANGFHPNGSNAHD